MKHTFKIALIATALSAPAPLIPAMAATPDTSGKIEMTMYKDPTCSCCEAYAAYLEKEGPFKVKLIPTNDLAQVSSSLGVPEKLQGCHAIKVGQYVIDGFVPVNTLKKFLIALPQNITGLSVPGMPMGAPGMGGEKMEPWTIYAFTKGSQETPVYAVE
jgi:hypothetical protein